MDKDPTSTDSPDESLNIPALAVHCGLEVFSDDDDEWQRLSPDGCGKWWRPSDRHPQELAESLWIERKIPDGKYRAVWAPRDRRSALPTGDPFYLTEADAAEWGDEPEPDDDDGEPAADAPAVAPKLVKVLRPHPSQRQRPRSNGVQVPARAPDRTVAAGHPLLYRHEQEKQDTLTSQFLFVHATYEKEAERSHQRMMHSHQLAIEGERSRSELAIESERLRSNQVLAFLQATQEQKASTQLVPLQQQIAQLATEFTRAQDDAAEDSEARLAEQLQTLQAQPEGTQATLNALGMLLQSPAGELLATGLRKLLGGPEQEEAKQMGPFDPAG